MQNTSCQFNMGSVFLAAMNFKIISAFSMIKVLSVVSHLFEGLVLLLDMKSYKTSPLQNGVCARVREHYHLLRSIAF